MRAEVFCDALSCFNESSRDMSVLCAYLLQVARRPWQKQQEGTCVFTPGNSQVLTMLKYTSTKNYYKTTTTTPQRHSIGDENKKGERCMSLPKSIPLVIFLMPGEFADLAAKRDYLARLFGHNID